MCAFVLPGCSPCWVCKTPGGPSPLSQSPAPILQPNETCQYILSLWQKFQRVGKTHTYAPTTRLLTSFASLSSKSSCQLALYLSVKEKKKWKQGVTTNTKSELIKSTSHRPFQLCFSIILAGDGILSPFSNSYAHTDRRSEPLQGFHLKNLTAHVPVAFRVFL